MERQMWPFGKWLLDINVWVKKTEKGKKKGFLLPLRLELTYSRLWGRQLSHFATCTIR